MSQNSRRSGIGSILSSSKASHYSEIDENDEWVAIQKFNTLLHFEEQKQAMLREAERKRLIKDELDRQVAAKRERKNDLAKENNLYHDMYDEHGKLLEDREIEKQNMVKQKIREDKESRDQ